VPSDIRKTFIFDYDRDAIQKKIYGKLITDMPDPFDKTTIIPCIQLFEDKKCETLADNSRKYLIDYYYEYEKEALIYTV
jgi:HKD family nuclease